MASISIVPSSAHLKKTRQVPIRRRRPDRICTRLTSPMRVPAYCSMPVMIRVRVCASIRRRTRRDRAEKTRRGSATASPATQRPGQQHREEEEKYRYQGGTEKALSVGEFGTLAHAWDLGGFCHGRLCLHPRLARTLAISSRRSRATSATSFDTRGLWPSSCARAVDSGSRRSAEGDCSMLAST